MRNRFGLLIGLVVAIGLIVSPLYGGHIRPFEWVQEGTRGWVWHATTEDYTVRHRGSSQTTREVKEIGISWNYAKDYILHPNGSGSRYINYSPYTSAIGRDYTYCSLTIEGLHQTTTGHWAEDYCAFGNPLLITESDYRQIYITIPYGSSEDDLRGIYVAPKEPMKQGLNEDTRMYLPQNKGV